MSKLMHFGMSLDDLVTRATAAPAKIMGYEGTVGTLKPGANADIALLERRTDNFMMTDSDGNTVTAKERLLARMTLKDGSVTYERPGRRYVAAINEFAVCYCHRVAITRKSRNDRAAVSPPKP